MVGKSFFSKLKSTLNFGSIENVLASIFQPVAKKHKKLADEVVEFILTGAPAGVLLDIGKVSSDDLCSAMELSPSLDTYGYFDKDTYRRYRADWYKAFAAGQVEIDVMVRYCKVLAEFGRSSLQKHTSEAFPDYLYLFLTDWLLIKTTRYYNSKQIVMPDLNGEMLRAMAEADGHPEPIWLSYYLDRKNSYYYNMSEALKPLDRLPGKDQLIRDNRGYFLEKIFPTLYAYGKANTLEVLAKLNMLSEFSELYIEQLIASSKSLRKSAEQYINKLPKDLLHKKLELYLLDGKTNERKGAAEIIGRWLGVEGKSLLEKALESESSQSVISVLTIALGASSLEQDAQEEEIVSLPEYTKPDTKNQVGQECVEIIYRKIQDLQDKQRGIQPEHDWEKEHKKRIMALSKSDAQSVVDTMNGKKARKFNWHNVANYVESNILWEHQDVQLVNVLNLYQFDSEEKNRQRVRLSWGPLSNWLMRHHGELTDLRQLRDVMQALDWPVEHLDQEILHNWMPSFLMMEIPKEGVWPYFSERIEILINGVTEAAISNSWDGINFERILDVIECFPYVPGALRPALLQLALGDGKRYRLRVQNILSSLPEIENQVKLALTSNTQSARINSARWLARIDSTSSIEPLKKALNKEKREIVRAALMSSLETLGEDISEYLSQDVLKVEADKGLSKKMPKGLEWFPFTALPVLKWQDGSSVDPLIPKWWLVLACKLKEPGGNDLLLKYLGLLDQESREEFGLFVLRAFIEQDTISPTLAEADAKAKQDAPQVLKTWQHWAKSQWGAEYRNKTLEDAERQIRQEVLSIYLGTAIKEKGILALCAYVPGVVAVPMIQSFMKEHYIRRTQIEAILTALAAGNDDIVIQLLLSVARRYRTRSVQEAARELVTNIAERNGWTQDELADRTMPTAGFDESGRMELNYGSRNFIVELDENLKPVLRNESGKIIKSLPAARQDDAPDLIKEAKSQLSSCKKELKQVVELTSGRLYEAMCSNRKWPVSDWRQYLFEHPVAIHLIQSLVWVSEQDSDKISFRATTDGALIDAEDNEVDLAEDSEIYLAHTSMLTKQEAKQWKENLKDYKIKQLFDQLGRPTLADDQSMDATTLDMYKGYFSDTFTLRGIFNKLGYQRGQAEDGGFYSYYYKDFNSLGLKAVINFSGNCVPEENVAAALYDMGICRQETQSWYFDANYLPLKDLPPVLLSEVIADYKTVADKTGGFNPDWEKQIPW